MTFIDETPLLTVENLSYFYGRHRGCEGVSFDLYPGEAMGVVGESGSGKSTLLRVIAGQDRPNAGTVTYRDMATSEQREVPVAQAAEAAAR